MFPGSLKRPAASVWPCICSQNKEQSMTKECNITMEIFFQRWIPFPTIHWVLSSRDFPVGHVPFTKPSHWANCRVVFGKLGFQVELASGQFGRSVQKINIPVVVCLTSLPSRSVCVWRMWQEDKQWSLRKHLSLKVTGTIHSISLHFPCLRFLFCAHTHTHPTKHAHRETHWVRGRCATGKGKQKCIEKLSGTRPNSNYFPISTCLAQHWHTAGPAGKQSTKSGSLEINHYIHQNVMLPKCFSTSSVYPQKSKFLLKSVKLWQSFPLSNQGVEKRGTLFTISMNVKRYRHRGK